MTENSSIDLSRLKDVEENYKRIREQIAQAALKSGREAGSIDFMAVTKTVAPAYINKAIDCGIDLIGENKVQEFLSKKDDLNLSNCRRHLIGHLQSNKVRQIAGQVDMIESVDSVKLAAEISKQSQKLNIVTPILLEVNIGREESKSGFMPEMLEEGLCEAALLPNISIQGLMTIPPVCDSDSERQKYFSNMYKTFIDISSKKLDNICMSILSMGMSGDFTAAIAQGATLVRVGSLLFGPRQYK